MVALSEQYGFDLNTVTWGYRDKFKRMIFRLEHEGFIGACQPENTSCFFAFLREHAGASLDDIASRFLTALCEGPRWIIGNPRLFSWWCALGGTLARCRLYAGSAFFALSGERGLGETPAQMERALRHIEALAEDRILLAVSFMRSYRGLCRRLSPRQIDVFVEQAAEVFRAAETTGCDFMEGKLETSEVYLRRITGEARLEEHKPRLQRIIRAITGRTIEVDHLGKLDSDELFERGSAVAAFTDSAYFPRRVHELGDPDRNARYYRLAAAVTGACYLFEGFAVLHGRPGMRSAARFLAGLGVPAAGMDAALALFECAEMHRIVQAMRRQFPGTRPLLDWGADILASRPAQTGGDEVLTRILKGQPAANAADRLIDAAAAGSRSCLDTAASVIRIIQAMPDGADLPAPPGPILFFPDPRFEAETGAAPPGTPVIDPSAADNAARDSGAHGDPDREAAGEGEGAVADPMEAQGAAAAAGYVYDEWNGIAGQYYRNWCLLSERRPEPSDVMTAAVFRPQDTARVRDVFDRIRPDLVRKEKYLPDGDAINIDRLVQAVILRKARIFDKDDFYERPLVRTRDLAVGLLIDMSGSTGGEVDDRVKILDLEKNAAAVLAEGLNLLGDRFGLFGFTGNGRENCEFTVFKEFDEVWSDDVRDRLFAVRPGASTRIGAALRHAGCKLRRTTARRKLLLMVTDGRPMDREYDPHTGYAYQDVCKACYENADAGIDTFGIITECEQKDVLMRMFPRGNFVVVSDIRELPWILASCFLHLTV